MIFDGKAFAREIEDEVKTRLRQDYGGRRPKIVSVLVGDDPASVLYTRLKQQAAERVGVQFEVVKLEINNNQITNIKQKIKEIGEREDVTGVMVQLPIPGLQGLTLKGILDAIPLAKDVDGLRWEESKIIPATVRAVLTIVDEIAKDKTKFVVIGARGTVGRSLVHFLKQRGVEVSEVEWDTPEPARIILAGDVVISCVGKVGVVQGDMVRDGSIVIDVGSPKGDMTAEAYQKASVSVEVPGGVGPVTIACLLANALEIYDRMSLRPRMYPVFPNRNNQELGS